MCHEVGGASWLRKFPEDAQKTQSVNLSGLHALLATAMCSPVNSIGHAFR